MYQYMIVSTLGTVPKNFPACVFSMSKVTCKYDMYCYSVELVQYAIHGRSLEQLNSRSQASTVHVTYA